MTYVTLIEREAIKRGHAEGLVEGQAELLLSQIERRFGPLDAETTRRVNAALPSVLRTWSLNILDATTLEDVFRG